MSEDVNMTVFTKFEYHVEPVVLKRCKDRGCGDVHCRLHLLRFVAFTIICLGCNLRYVAGADYAIGDWPDDRSAS